MMDDEEERREKREERRRRRRRKRGEREERGERKEREERREKKRREVLEGFWRRRRRYKNDIFKVQNDIFVVVRILKLHSK